MCVCLCVRACGCVGVCSGIELSDLDSMNTESGAHASVRTPILPYVVNIHGFIKFFHCMKGKGIDITKCLNLSSGQWHICGGTDDAN